MLPKRRGRVGAGDRMVRGRTRGRPTSRPKCLTSCVGLCGAREDTADAGWLSDTGSSRRKGGRSGHVWAGHRAGRGEGWRIVRSDGGRRGCCPGALRRRKSLIVK